MPLNQTILLAVTGMSPAVLTETVWALAQERPPMVPDRVVAVAAQKAKRLLADLEKSFPGRVATFEATLAARLMVNLAGGVVENAGMAMDRCFGMPLLPGSAVKGLARSQALADISAADGADKAKLLRNAMALFGYGAHDVRGDFAVAGGGPEARRVAQALGGDDFRGCASFLPAYPTTKAPLVVEMVNPHYPEYYSGKRPKAKDNESPIPNYFPAVEAGATFGFAVWLNRLPNLPDLEAGALLRQAREWLERAVTIKGAGAKTGAGYGWFELGRPSGVPASVPVPPAQAPQLSPGDACISRWRDKLATKDNFPVALPEILALTEVEELRRVFEAVVPELERKRNRKTSPYWQAFTSGRHGETGKAILNRLAFKLI